MRIACTTAAGRAGWRALPAALAGLLALAAACTQRADHRRMPDAGEQASGQWREELFDVAIDNLNRLEEYDSAAMLQEVSNRMGEWLQHQEPPAGWTLDPLAAALPQPLSLLPHLREPKRRDFTRFDAEALREAVWFRDVARWAAGTKSDPAMRAVRLFDWTVRNIQLTPPPKGESPPPQLPWETLLLGEGTAADLAWAFLLLARQQGLDAAMLGIAPAETSQEGQTPQPWVVGVLVDERILLFDPRLGAPVPGPKGLRRDDRGRLEIRPASLDEVVADPALLEQMRTAKGGAYPVGAAELGRVVALVEASPASLSLKMKLIESRLAGERRMRLVSAPAAQAERWKSLRHVSEARLWRYPFETTYRWLRAMQEENPARRERFYPFEALADRGLWKARVLHLRHEFTGEEGAIQAYQVLRPSNDLMQTAESKRAERHAEFARRQNAQLSQPQLKAYGREQAERETRIMVRAKQDASYWLGLVSYEREAYPVAVDFFLRRTLQAWPDGPWTAGARYNLGRTYEAQGEEAQALAVYGDSREPAAALRGAWLEQTRPKDRGKPQ